MPEIKEIWKTFNPGTVNEKQALRGVSLTLKDGDFCTVIGGNGAGKSTMLNAVAGTWMVDEGAITIGGTDVTRLPEYKRAPYIGRVFKDPMLGTAPTKKNTRPCSTTWIWGWRTASPAKWVCCPAASGRRLPC
jgi:putative ABC transport system ATP-binding protein